VLFRSGYAAAKVFRYDDSVARTVSIEVGMQNSALGAVLAKTRFAAEPLTAVPSALSSVCHSLIGSLLAGWWRWRG
jgi:BASS family bile acid:Na+ symporter